MALSSSILRSGLSSLWRSSTTFHHSLKMLSATSNYCQMRDSFATNTGKNRSCLNPKLKSSTKLTGNSTVNESKQSTPKDSLAEFIAEVEGLIDSRNQTIETAKQKRTYNPYSREWKEWAESFYVIKGDLTSASLFSLDAFLDFLRNICDDEKCRRDFVLYKDIPLSEASMDFRENFQQEGFEYNKHIICPNIELKLDVPLPNGYESVLPLPAGFHVILNSSSLRIISYVTREELFRSWRLNFGEQEKHINMLCRRNGQKRMMALMSGNIKEGK